jgi:23S rRNA (adenine2503-C2)-methyltransferase
MIEYVLIPGVNDAREHAAELADYLRGIRCCVNVIPYNPRRDSPWQAPTERSIAQFLEWLGQAGQYCKRRVTKGRDHMAACGQLGNRDLVRCRG